MREEGRAGYRKLEVWYKADELAMAVYHATKQFPREELYGLTSQLRRAALSVPTNIVEGAGRHGKSWLKQFTSIALGSLAETEYLLSFCHRLSYLDDSTYQKLEALRQTVGRLLWNFYRSL